MLSTQNENRGLRLASMAYDDHLKSSLVDKKDIVDYLTNQLENKSTELCEFRDRLNLYNQQKNFSSTEFNLKLSEQQKVFEEKIQIITNENLILGFFCRILLSFFSF
jgi:hypothetical protein